MSQDVYVAGVGMIPFAKTLGEEDAIATHKYAARAADHTDLSVPAFGKAGI